MKRNKKMTGLIVAKLAAKQLSTSSDSVKKTLAASALAQARGSSLSCRSSRIFNKIKKIRNGN